MMFGSIKSYLNQSVDNSSLIIFRMAFGLLIAAESFGAILTGWVKRVFIEPEFTFSFIGFEWLQPLPGYGMYFYYGLMGCAGLMVMLGWYYRYSLGLFSLLWWATYLMQKTSYNNHYYLLILLCFLMLLVPAHRNGSLDVKSKRVTAMNTCPRWAVEIFKWQLLIVYSFAAVAKIYPGWLEGTFISLSFASKANYPIIGPWLQTDWIQQTVVVGGLIYDLTIIPLMYWSKSRKAGFIVSAGFHLFNSVVFGIGIFPYLMLASLVLFFPTDKWRSRIPGYLIPSQTQEQLPANTRQQAKTDTQTHFQTSPWLWAVLLAYFILQLWLPVRHYFIPGDVLKTEEGHRMAWRMMLRSKYGTASFRVLNNQTGETQVVQPGQYLTFKQSYKMGGRPDMIWQFAQYLQKQYATQGIDDIAIFVDARANVNGASINPLIDPEVDLLSVSWKRFGHNTWIVADN